MHYFWSPNKRIKWEEEEEEGQTKPRYTFSDFCMEIMDSSMILVHELIGYGLLGFYLEDILTLGLREVWLKSPSG